MQLTNYSDFILKGGKEGDGFYHIKENYREEHEEYRDAELDVKISREHPFYDYHEVKALKGAKALRDGDKEIKRLQEEWLGLHPEGEAWLYFWGARDTWLDGGDGEAANIYAKDIAEITRSELDIMKGDNPVEPIVERFKGK